MSDLFLLLYVFVWAVLCLFSLHRLFLVFLYFRHKGQDPSPHSSFTELPRVTIQLPIYNEKEVLSRLLGSVAAVSYPKELLDIQLLDDSTDECRELAAREVEILQDAGVPIRHIHRQDRVGYKAGALKNGLKSANGEFILILDSDFIPPADLLYRVVPHFTDPGVGCVQMRWEHVNRDFSLLTRVQAMLLDGHFAIEQVARNRSGRFFNFNGTAGVWRKSCIEDAGGWQGDTLTEDLDLSYRAQLRGWSFLFLSHVTVPAELPVQVAAFKLQQGRWAKGSIQTARKLIGSVWKSGVPLKAKVEATFHLTMNFSYPFILLLMLLVGLSMRRPFIVYPFFVTATVSLAVFYLFSQVAVGRGFLRALRDIPLLLAVGVGMSVNNTVAVLEGLFLSAGEFQRTPKGNVSAGERARSWAVRWSDLKPSSLLEAGMGCYFLYLSIAALYLDRVWLLPFLLIFGFGFTYIGVNSWFCLIRTSGQAEPGLK